jgi:hypothetical protein
MRKHPFAFYGATFFSEETRITHKIHKICELFMNRLFSSMIVQICPLLKSKQFAFANVITMRLLLNSYRVGRLYCPKVEFKSPKVLHLQGAKSPP